MAKYNLMDNQRPDYFDRYFEEDQQKKAKKDVSRDQDSLDLNVPSESEDMFDESLFTISKDEQNIEQDIDVAAPAPTAMPDEAAAPVTDEAMAIGAEKKVDDFSEYEYGAEDSFDYEPAGKKGGFFKFFLIVVLLGAVAYLIIHYLPQIKQLSIFSKKTESAATKQVTTPVQPEAKLKSEQDIKRENFLKTINRENKNKLGYITTLISLKPSDIHYSGLFLYGNTLNLEIFGSRRDDLARFNMKLKNNSYIKDYHIYATDNRPGTNGGIFSLFNIKLLDKSIPTENLQIADNLKSPDSWLSNVKNKFNLTVKSQRSVSTKNENLFKVSRMEYILQGSRDKCFGLINDMAGANLNYSIYKLMLLPSNQRNITSSLYQLNLIMDFYLK